MQKRILTGVVIALMLCLPAVLWGQAAAEYGAHIGGVAAPSARAASGLGHATNSLAGRATDALSRPQEGPRRVYDRRVVMGRERAGAANANSMPGRQVEGFQVQRTAVDCSAVDLKTTKDKAAAKSAEPACVQSSAATPAAANPDKTKYPAAITLSFKK